MTHAPQTTAPLPPAAPSSPSQAVAAADRQTVKITPTRVSSLLQKLRRAQKAAADAEDSLAALTAGRDPNKSAIVRELVAARELVMNGELGEAVAAVEGVENELGSL